MRRTTSFFALAFVAAVVAASGLVGPAGAGGGAENEVVVEKVVAGPVPAGAQFEVEVSCLNQDNGHGEPTVTTLTFDETGAPVGVNSVVLNPASATCTVTETVTNGATVSYACSVQMTPVTPPSDADSNGADAQGGDPVACLDDQTVQFVDIDLAVGTVTVTNTFPEEPEPEAEADAAAAPAGVVAATPTFTG